MMKAFFVILFLGCTFISLTAFAQCDVKSEVVVKAASSGSNGSIQLKITNDLQGPIRVSLHDLTEQDLPIVTEKSVQMKDLKEGVTFSGLKPTTYIIQVHFRNCSRTIGGLEGYKVESK
jgi:hypothetical protein